MILADEPEPVPPNSYQLIGPPSSQRIPATETHDCQYYAWSQKLQPRIFGGYFANEHDRRVSCQRPNYAWYVHLKKWKPSLAVNLSSHNHPSAFLEPAKAFISGPYVAGITVSKPAPRFPCPCRLRHPLRRCHSKRRICEVSMQQPRPARASVVEPMPSSPAMFEAGGSARPRGCRLQQAQSTWRCC